jgi:hypothetical protein
VSGVRTPDDPPDIQPKVMDDFGLFFFYLIRIKFITSTNTFTKSRKCHSAAHDGMAFFDAV